MDTSFDMQEAFASMIPNGIEIPEEEFEVAVDYIKDKIIEITPLPKDALRFDMKEFREGINIMSNVCGQITALVNAGITPTKALDYIVERDSASVMMKHNIELAEINSKTAIEAAKYECVIGKANSI